MYNALRPLLFRLPPERAHSLTVNLLRLAGAMSPTRALLQKMYACPDHPTDLFGLHFRNPVGLAAGYDKDGLAWRGLACLGFGHLEIGTVTPKPQPGNPTPRIFRLVEDEAVINRMGFPGRGAAFLFKQLQGPRPPGLVLGVNLGKNKETPNEAALQDYRVLLQMFAPLADYLAVNVSSPNTEGLRGLQARAALEGLLEGLAEERARQSAALGRQVPLLVKLAPDLDANQLDDALEAILHTGMDGVIATNTTTSRSGSGVSLLRSRLQAEAGGLSGAPLTGRSRAMVAHIVRQTGGKLPVIGVGGIMTPDDARRMLDAGAALVQVYTGLVYHGPGLVQQICNGLSAFAPTARKDGEPAHSV